MEGLYSNNNNAKTPKLKSLNGNVSPINTQMVMEASDSMLLMRRFLRSGSPAAQKALSAGEAFSTPAGIVNRHHPYRSGSNSNSSRSSRGGSSPLSAVENVRSPTVYKTPVKMEEDEVVVMDAILVGSSPSGTGFYKTEICRSWEGSGKCRHGLKCQFAHGKEELRPTRFPFKSKSEAQLCKSYTTTGSYTYGPKRGFVNQVMTAAATEAAAPPPPPPVQTASPTKLEYTSKSPTTTFTTRDWSPQDDGIVIALPSTYNTPSRADVDAYVEDVLYGPTATRRSRLPEFAEICPQ